MSQGERPHITNEHGDCVSWCSACERRRSQERQGVEGMHSVRDGLSTAARLALQAAGQVAHDRDKAIGLIDRALAQIEAAQAMLQALKSRTT